MKLLKITAITDPQESSDGRNYVTVTFQEVAKIAQVPGANGTMKNVTLMSTKQARKRTLWETGLSTKTNTIINGFPGYDELAVGQYLEGSIHTVDTEPYEISNGGETRIANSATLVVFDGSETLAQVAKSQGLVLKSSTQAVVAQQQVLTEAGFGE
jgi:hypothetical protein